MMTRDQLEQVSEALQDAYMHTEDKEDYQTFRTAYNICGAALAEPRGYAGKMPPDQEDMDKAALGLAPWLSAALDDPKVCDEYKSAINAWFNAAMPAALAEPSEPVGFYAPKCFASNPSPQEQAENDCATCSH